MPGALLAALLVLVPAGALWVALCEVRGTDPAFWRARRPRPPALSPATAAAELQSSWPGCRAVKVDLSPLPGTLTVDEAMARLAFPERANDASCAAWKRLDDRITAEQVAIIEKGPPVPVASEPPLLGFSGCGQSVEGKVFSEYPKYLRGGYKVVQAYERDLERCGHVGERDLKCERAALRARQEQWRVTLETERRKTCGLRTEVLSIASVCRERVETLRDAPVARWFELMFLWRGLRLLSNESEASFCPPLEPQWPPPMPR